MHVETEDEKLNASIAIFPDNFARYRAPVFTAIAGKEISVTIFSPEIGPARGGVSIAHENRDYFLSKCLCVTKNRNYLYHDNILWTTKVAVATLIKSYTHIIVWGEIQNISVWFSLLIGWLLRRDVYIWTHGMYGRENWLKHALRIAQARLATGVLLYGKRAKCLLSKGGVSKKKLHVVYNSIDYEGCKKIRSLLGTVSRRRLLDDIGLEEVPESSDLWVFCGRIKRSRKLEVIFNAMRYLIQNCGIQIYFAIIGGGDSLYEKECDEIARSLGLADFIYRLPSTYNEEIIGSAFLASNLVVCADGIGLLAVHACSYGRPVATHSCMEHQKPEVEIVLKDQTGFFFERDSGDSLALSYVNWIKMTKGKNISKMCIDHVEKFFTPEAQTIRIRSALGLK